METFILNHWPFLIAPVYILAGVVNCWVMHLFFKNNRPVYLAIVNSCTDYHHYVYQGLSGSGKFFGFTIGLVLVPAFLIIFYLLRMINKLLP